MDCTPVHPLRPERLSPQPANQTLSESTGFRARAVLGGRETLWVRRYTDAFTLHVPRFSRDGKTLHGLVLAQQTMPTFR